LQVFKQKGEEYRIHGQWGWVWMSNLRKCTPTDSRKQGLLAGPSKHVIQVKNELGKVKTILIEPSVFEKLMAKRSLSQKTTALSSTSTPVKSCDTNEKSSATAEEKSIKVEEQEILSKEDEQKSDSDVKHEADSKEEAKCDDATSKSTSQACERKSSEDSESRASIDEKMDIDSATSENPNASATESITSSADDVKIEEDLKVPTVEENLPDRSSGAELVKPESKEGIKEDSIKEEDKAGVEKSTAASEDLSKTAVSKPKFKTELINVSLGIQSANRILYPKIAHRSSVLDSLLTRRMKLQQLEEMNLQEEFGQEMLEKAKKLEIEEKEEDKEVIILPQEEILDDTFPLAGIYRYKCFSYSCQSAAAEFMAGLSKSKTRDYEFKCYSPMCRLKYYVQESERKKEEKTKEQEKDKVKRALNGIRAKRMYTQVLILNEHSNLLLLIYVRTFEYLRNVDGFL